MDDGWLSTKATLAEDKLVVGFRVRGLRQTDRRRRGEIVCRVDMAATEIRVGSAGGADTRLAELLGAA